MEVEFSQIAERSYEDADQIDNGIIIVVPGEVITTEPGFLKGHGVYMDGDRMIASVCGVVERVNKLIFVTPLKSRYIPKIGDVVIGRVTELSSNVWKMEIGSTVVASLSINSVNLPGGENRRRTDADILQMRSIFAENDLISAEVQKVDDRGSTSLHTRSSRYGKLTNGVLVVVPPSLVKRQKEHFINLECKVGCILGTNGYIWVRDPLEVAGSNINNAATMEMDKQKVAYSEKVVEPNVRHRIARVVASINKLKNEWRMISKESIMEVYNTLL